MLAEEKKAIKKIAETDQLTGLRNRVSLEEDIALQVESNYRRNHAIGFALFDIDDFKRINDGYGHAMGDECLKKIGERFLDYDMLTVYRYGGEEFLVVSDTVSEDEFGRIIGELLRKIAGLELSAQEARITISAGFTYGVPANEHYAESMINTADGALYKAKRAGKNCFFKA